MDPSSPGNALFRTTAPSPRPSAGAFDTTQQWQGTGLHGLIRRYGALRFTVYVSLAAVIVSDVLTVLLALSLGATVDGITITMGTVIPALIAPVATYSFARLLEQLDLAHEKMHILATRDSLTGLANRRHFFHLASLEWSRAARYGRPLSLLMLDLDRFKSINDTFGHLAGDEVLRAIARRCLEGTRLTDVVCRFGGEEIAVLLPETSPTGALAVAQRLLASINGEPVQCGEQTVTATASIGVATRQESMATVEDLLAKADTSLYQAKKNGRNCIGLP